MAIVPVGVDGRIELWVNAGAVELIADVVGYFGGSGGRLVAVHGRRLLSTATGSVRRSARSPLVGRSRSRVAGRAGVPVGAIAALLNVTGVRASTSTNLRVYPSGTARPNASSLNVAPGGAVANLVLAKLGTGGRVRIFNAQGAIDVIADVTGYVV